MSLLPDRGVWSTMTMATTATQRIAAWAAALAPDDIPEAVRDAAELHALDALGCAFAAHGTGEGDAVRALAREEGGVPQAAAIGLGRVPAATAALVNGTLAHTLDFDDTHDASVCHISAVVTPAAVAGWQAATSTGSQPGAPAAASAGSHGDLAAALVAGNEVVARLGMAAPRAFHARGFHPTSVCGVFGATTAAALLRGLDEDGITRALGLAGSLASGLFAYLSDGSPTKPLHAGWAAAAGVRAAALAAHGLSGPAAILEDRHGLYAAYTDGPHTLDEQLADLGDRWETPAIEFKAYPACHFIHGALDALRAAGDLDGDDVTRIDATINAAGAPLVSDPREDKLTPTSPYGARFSLPYALAAQLVTGSAGARTFTQEAIGDAAVLARTPDVHTHVYDRPTASFAGGVTVTLRDGTAVTHHLDAPRGLDAQGVRDKARDNAALAGVDLAHPTLTDALDALVRLSS